jgi:hypothetical protein
LYEEIDGVDRVGTLRGFEEVFSVRGDTGLAFSAAKADEDLNALALVGFGCPVDELQRLRIPADGVVGGELVAGAIVWTPVPGMLKLI